MMNLTKCCIYCMVVHYTSDSLLGTYNMWFSVDNAFVCRRSVARHGTLQFCAELKCGATLVVHTRFDFRPATWSSVHLTAIRRPSRSRDTLQYHTITRKPTTQGTHSSSTSWSLLIATSSQLGDTSRTGQHVIQRPPQREAIIPAAPAKTQTIRRHNQRYLGSSKVSPG